MQAMADAGFKLLAFEAEKTLVLDLEEVVETADLKRHLPDGGLILRAPAVATLCSRVYRRLNGRLSYRHWQFQSAWS